MKILKLEAENVKKIKVLEITPDGNLVQITGKNGQGKTSVLDSIWWALAGADNIQKMPIRAGEEEARIRLDLGEIVVTRTFKEGKDGKHDTLLTVTNATGAKFPTPQKMMDELLDSLSFDPLAFARMKARDQFEAMRRFVPDVDFDAIEKAQKMDFDTRTALNRRAKEARTLAESIVTMPGDPTTRVDDQALIKQLSEAAAQNDEITQRANNRIKLASEIEDTRLKAS